MEDRIRYLEREIYRKKHIPNADLSNKDKQVLKETLFKYGEELGKAKQFYFQLDEIELYAEHSSI